MIDLNAGSFLAICSDLELMVKEEYPPLKIMELILSQHSGIDGYRGHDFNYLIPLFPKISIIKINSDILGVNPDNLELISSLLISYNSEFIKLPINSDTLEKIQQLCYKNFNLFRYDNLFQTLITTNFKFAFLNLYRSVEMLYQLCYISDLGEKLDIDKIELLNAIDITLKWKPNERNSLCKILNGVSPNERQILTKQLPKIIRETTGKTICSTDALWSWLYDLRCNIVHLKVNHSVINISNKNWNLIFQGLIEVLISTYNFYD